MIDNIFFPLVVPSNHLDGTLCAFVFLKISSLFVSLCLFYFYAFFRFLYFNYHVLAEKFTTHKQKYMYVYIIKQERKSQKKA